MDTLTKAERSKRMSLIKAKNTKPELLVRKMLRTIMTSRPSLHAIGLPGKPDFAFQKNRKAIFVHGCFWHRHEVCSSNRIPKSRRRFWIEKLEGNKKRDLLNGKRLNRMGWSYIVIWECQLKKPESVIKRLKRHLGVNHEIN